MAEAISYNYSSSSDQTPENQRLTIRDIAVAAEAQTKEGDTFYLITQRWWQQWLEYVNQDKPNATKDLSGFLVQQCDVVGSNLKKPCGIDNSDLIYDTTSESMDVEIELHDTLVEGRDYVLLPQEVWNQLYLWYGGGPTLSRKVISSGLSQMELSVEVYPLRLQLLVMPKGDHTTIRISKKETVAELHRRACEVFDLNSEQVCIWDYYGHQKHTMMKDMYCTLDETNIQTDQDILVEVVNNTTGSCLISVKENGSPDKEAAFVLVEPSKSSLSIAGGLAASKNVSRGCSSEFAQGQNLFTPVSDSDDVHGVSGVTTRGASSGLTGLLNLGNTCFMNSAIQCLVHTPEFARYFREDFYKEINVQNPLGMVGELARPFGDLLRKLWAPGRMPVAPRAFKARLARFAPQFSGYNQHDSQELLAFLLDGLHEDLNRVKNKPYIKSKDADGRPDEDVANEYWANHIARNDSIIVDVCQGQYKSTLVCPVCSKVSVTFDPFMYLSLPLQSTNTRTMTVTIFTSDGSVLPTAFTVTVPKQGRCRDLIQALDSACSLKQSEMLLLGEIRCHLIHYFLEDPLTLLSTIKDDNRLAAYKIPRFLKNTVFLQLIHRRKEQDFDNAQGKVGWKPFGTPLVSPISRDDVTKGGDIHSMVLKMLSPLQHTTKHMNNKCDNTTVSLSLSDPSQDSDSRVVPIDPSEMGKPKLSLQLVNENDTCIDISVCEEKPIKLPPSSTSMLLFIDWSDELLQNYDTHYLENLQEVLKYGSVAKKARTEPLSLYTCLEAFLREEPLVPEDMWFCPRCKESRQASKKLDLWRLPEVLVIHLKRFSYSRSMKHKLETFVNFPIHDLDLTNYVAHNTTQPQAYELYALTNHYGGMGSGHYTAHIKVLDENKWYSFDDSHISPINEDDVKSGAAYVLFYKRLASP